MPSKKPLKVSELKAGMISAVDINFEGKVLLAKGTTVTQSVIAKLIDHYIVDSVDILVEEKSQNPITVNLNAVKELETTFNEMSANLEDIFSDLSKVKGSNMIRLRTFLQKIQEEFKATNNVIRDVIFYGSGQNVIFRHSINVTAISYILGKWLGFSIHELNILLLSAILHDFGKMDIDESILKKMKSNLTAKEFDIYKSHTVSGYHFIKKINFISPSVGPSVLLHHEKMDGSGYPLHLSGKEIPKFSRVIAIADLFDTVNSNRYSGRVKGPFDALKIIKEESLTKLDTMYCNMFLNHIVNYLMGEYVILSDKRTAKIIQVYINDLTRPLLLGDDGFIDLKKEHNLHVESFAV